MKPSVKKEWIRQLRSGEIEQSQGMLRDVDGSMCVLGVLCNVHAVMNPNIAETQTDPTRYLGEKYGLPEEVKRWANIKDSLSVVHKGRRQSLMSLNDFEHMPFEQIADLIEKQL